MQITGVRLQETEDGLEVVLETPTGELSAPESLIDGNVLIADIPNAVLALPDQKEFTTENPAAGIAAITVTQQENNQVRVLVTGIEDTPTLQIGANNGGLTLNISAATSDPDIEITVTAQKRTEDAQDVPLSLTVIPRQELEDGQVSSFSSIANNTPNFTFSSSSSGSAEYNYYSMRGLSNFNAFTNQDTVAFYIDDVPFDYGGFLDLGLIDLERVIGDKLRKRGNCQGWYL